VLPYKVGSRVLSGDLLDLRPLFFERGRSQARGDAAVLQKFNLFFPFVCSIFGTINKWRAEILTWDGIDASLLVNTGVVCCKVGVGMLSFCFHGPRVLEGNIVATKEYLGTFVPTASCWYHIVNRTVAYRYAVEIWIKALACSRIGLRVYASDWIRWSFMNNFMLVVSLKKKIMLVDDFDLALDQSSLGRILCVCPHWSYPDPVTQTYPQESYAIVRTSTESFTMEFRIRAHFWPNSLWRLDMDIRGKVFMWFIPEDSSGLICVNFYVNSELNWIAIFCHELVIVCSNPVFVLPAVT